MRKIVIISFIAVIVLLNPVNSLARAAEVKESSCCFVWMQSEASIQNLNIENRLTTADSQTQVLVLSPMDLGAYKYESSDDSVLYQILVAIAIVLSCVLIVVITLIILSYLQQPRHTNQLYPNSSFFNLIHHHHTRHFLSHPKHCIHCGTKNKLSAKTCKKCGKPFLE